MIRLPRGKALQRNLDTTYVQFDGVLRSMHREAHTGYLRVVSEEAEGVLFLRDGDLIAPVFESGGKTVTGMPALEEMLVWLGKHRAFLEICRLDHDLLRSLLAFHHGTCRILKAGKVPADPAALEALVSGQKMTGAVIVDAPDGPVHAFAADGAVIGMWFPDVDRWSPSAVAWTPGAERCEVWECPDTDTLRTVDLDLQRVELHETLRRAVEQFVPGFGDYVFDLEVRKQEAANPAHMPKAAFYLLADGLRARCRLLIGARRAGELGTVMRTAVGRLIDAGI